MIASQRAAMASLRGRSCPGTVELADRQVNRAIRLMRVFTEQVETLSRLKGKSSQQRVIVEHVTVAGRGKAIVGALIPEAGGRTADMGDEPHEP